MEPPSFSGIVFDQDKTWERLQELLLDAIDRLKASWRERGEETDLQDFLPSAGDPNRPLVLEELVILDLEYRWEAGKGQTLERYLRRYPELGGPEAVSPTLLFEEYRVRQQYGDKPALKSYRDRFPNQYRELEALARDRPSAMPTLSPAQTPGPPRPAASVVQGQTVLMNEGYKLIRRLGAGGFGEVWQAEAAGGVEVAVKVIYRPADHEAAQRELEALELMKRLRHPFLAQVQAFWTLEDRILIVMDLANGTLRDRLAECVGHGLDGIPAEELAGYTREAAEALDYLHANRVLHRDVKPDNILLLERHARLTDYGLARLLESRRIQSTRGSGTPGYMPPETWRGQAGPAGDQYSLAAAYVEVRLNRPLFASRQLVKLMQDHMTSVPDLPGLAGPERHVLLKALAKDPAQRYASCRDFAAALENAIRLKETPPPANRDTFRDLEPPKLDRTPQPPTRERPAPIPAPVPAPPKVEPKEDWFRPAKAAVPESPPPCPPTRARELRRKRRARQRAMAAVGFVVMLGVALGFIWLLMNRHLF